MRAILIDPAKQSISSIELPDPHTIQDIYAAIGAGCFDIINLGGNADMFVNDEGLMTIPRDDEDIVTQDFFVIVDNKGIPRYMVAGKAMIAGHNDEDTIDCPMQLERVAPVIKWVPRNDDMREQAAEIAEALINQTQVVGSAEELAAIRQNYNVLMRAALNLTKGISIPKE